MMRVAVIVGVLTVPVPPAQAHPHAFIDTTMTVAVTDGAATAVELTWVYDAFTSMLILSDRALFPDADGTLSAAQLDELAGFDITGWPEDFAGDLFAEAGGAPVALGPPQGLSIAFDAQGRIVTRHRRSLPDVPAEDLVLRQYDPTYYIAYSLQPPVTVTGPCEAEVAPHDPAKAEAEIETELTRVPEDMFEIMQIGHLYADTVTLDCKGSS